MASPSDKTPDFTTTDYIKFFGAGALAATVTHGVGKNTSPSSPPQACIPPASRRFRSGARPFES